MKQELLALRAEVQVKTSEMQQHMREVERLQGALLQSAEASGRQPITAEDQTPLGAAADLEELSNLKEELASLRAEIQDKTEQIVTLQRERAEAHANLEGATVSEDLEYLHSQLQEKNELIEQLQRALEEASGTAVIEDVIEPQVVVPEGRRSPAEVIAGGDAAGKVQVLKGELRVSPVTTATTLLHPLFNSSSRHF